MAATQGNFCIVSQVQAGCVIVMHGATFRAADSIDPVTVLGPKTAAAADRRRARPQPPYVLPTFIFANHVWCGVVQEEAAALRRAMRAADKELKAHNRMYTEGDPHGRMQQMLMDML